MRVIDGDDGSERDDPSSQEVYPYVVPVSFPPRSIVVWMGDGASRVFSEDEADRLRDSLIDLRGFPVSSPESPDNSKPIYVTRWANVITMRQGCLTRERHMTTSARAAQEASRLRRHRATRLAEFASWGADDE